MLTFSIFSAVLGMLQFGYNTGVINAPQSTIEDFIAKVHHDRTGQTLSPTLKSFIWSVTVSIFAVGGMVGGFSGGYVANYFGRKRGLLLNNGIALLGGALMGLSKLATSYETLIAGRLLIGLNCGLATALSPMYLAEIAPKRLRGALGTVAQLGVTVGLLLAQIMGLPSVLGTASGWPTLLGLALAPAVLQLLLLPFCPESPRYLLITKARLPEATKALIRLRATPNVEEDIEEMEAEERAQQAEASISMCELLRSKALRTPLIIGVVMQLSQQLSGINVIFYYSTALFTSAGVEEAVAKYSTLGVGLVMVVMTLVSVALIDRAGRRTLHLTGLGGMFIFSIALTVFILLSGGETGRSWIGYLSIGSALLFTVFFAIGPGSIPWMITAELFSQGPRPAAMSIAVLVNWAANMAVGLLFPLMTSVKWMEKIAFLPFTLCLALCWVFTYFKVPETKGRTFEEIAALFVHRR